MKKQADWDTELSFIDGAESQYRVYEGSIYPTLAISFTSVCIYIGKRRRDKKGQH